VINLIKFIVLLTLVSSLQAKVIKDLNNQDITVPDNVEAAFGSSPPMNYLLYALNPEKMSGLNFSAKNQNNTADELFLSKKFLSLPVIGSFHGGGQSINLETIIKHNPDLILLWEDDLLIGKVQKEIAKTNIPTITLPFRKIQTMPRSIAYAGEAIGEKTRGDLLASYTQNIIDEIKTSLDGVKPTKYYYAEGLDGLSTECSVSFHVEALNFAGGENVHKCEQRALLGLEKINFETLLSYDPDIIIAQNIMTYNSIMKNPLWQHLRAVKEKNVHIVPNNPFNWIDRPPSFMRIIGIQWLSKLFHPNEYDVNIHERVKEFYKLFLNVELSDTQVKELLGENK
jgi:iron complex transport system substrate-binding protein